MSPITVGYTSYWFENITPAVMSDMVFGMDAPKTITTLKNAKAGDILMSSYFINNDDGFGFGSDAFFVTSVITLGKLFEVANVKDAVYDSQGKAAEIIGWNTLGYIYIDNVDSMIAITRY